MKLSKGLKWFSALLVTTSVLSTTVPVTAAPFSLFGSKEQLSDEDIQKIQEVYRSIREGYIEEIDKEKILEGALKGMVSATEDPYSEYFNKEESTAFDNAMSDSFEGIGRRGYKVGYIYYRGYKRYKKAIWSGPQPGE